MQVIIFPFYFLLYLILAIACAKWIASRLRHQTTVATPARATIKSTKIVLPVLHITSITARPGDRKRVRFFWLMAERRRCGHRHGLNRPGISSAIYADCTGPDILHVHNFWTALTPSVHAAAHSEGVPTVQTLHNYRLLCTNSLLLRNNKPCVECVGKLPWRGIVHKCYRSSFASSAAVARMIVCNRARQTWHRHVNAFIALSQFSRCMLQAGGVPPDRLFVKPNFVEDPGETATQPSQSRTMAYAGRLSREKGVDGLLAAWALLVPSERGRLVIVGAGPEERALRESARSLGLSEADGQSLHSILARWEKSSAHTSG
jgi:glycosyltransferase involved in cell wall biosynthesis